MENSGDTKLTIVSSDNTAVGGAAVVLGHSNFTVGGFYPAYEMQYGINNGRYLRFNYLLRTTNGIIQSAVPNIMILSDNSRVGINLGPPDGALTPNYPTANLHTNGTVRFQGLPNGTGNPLVVDVNGNVFVGSTPTSNAWNLTGNSGTNPANNFLGTTDNNRLVFRTNNTEKVTILANGNTGFGLSVPASPVHVFSATDDNQLFLSGSAPSTRFFQGQDWNASAFHARVGLATGNANYVSTSVPGDFVVQVLDNGSLLFGTNGAGANGLERMRISSIGYIGIATTNPTAKLHVNCVAVPGQPNPSNIRFENLPTGTGFALVMDANGYVFKSSSLVGRNEVNELKDEIIGLKEELQMLQNVVNSMKDGYFILKNSKEGAFLYQNNPNPFYQETTIRYFLPAGSSNAILQINDVLGTTIKTYLLDSEGRQSITIDGGALSAGTYFYTLIINGKKADTKKMILTK